MEISDLVSLAIESQASDLHLSSGLTPIIRVDGHLKRLHLPVLEQKEISRLMQGLMNEEQKRIHKETLELDFAFQLEGLCRLRVNLFTQARGTSVVLRLIPSQIKTLDEFGFPAVFKDLCSYPKGLVLLTGPAGSGKSTTLAAMIDHINHHNKDHILTIEDPIEFAHKSDKCLINQRELGQSTHSFEAALRSALREDPDVILVGEMRDLETVRLALTAAETGHLVFSTLHTNSAAETIDRIVNIFPTGEQYLIRSMLSVALQGVISQVLLKKIGGGRVVAHEIMMCTPAIRNMIRENKVPQIFSALQTGQNLGMHTMEQYVHELLKQGKIDKATAEPYFRG